MHRVFASTNACDHATVRVLLSRICPRNDPIGIPSGTNFGPIWGSDPRSAAGMTPTKRASDNMMKITCCKPKMWLFPERQCDFQICNCPTWERFEAVIKPQIVKNQLVFVTFSEIDATSALCTPRSPKTAIPIPLRRRHRKCEMCLKPGE